MPGLVLPDPPLSDGVVSLRGFGYLLGAPARGNGYATRAVGLLAGWAFGTLGLERLELRAQKENAASRAVARRAGFAPVDAPVVQRPECDQQPDVYFARLRA